MVFIHISTYIYYVQHKQGGYGSEGMARPPASTTSLPSSTASPPLLRRPDIRLAAPPSGPHLAPRRLAAPLAA